MGANDAKEMLEVAKQECVRLERENAALRETIRLGTEQLEATRAQAVSLPDRDTLIDVFRKTRCIASPRLERGYGCPVPEEAERMVDAVLAALSTQPRTDDYEAGYEEGFHHGRSTPIQPAAGEVEWAVKQNHDGRTLVSDEDGEALDEDAARELIEDLPYRATLMQRTVGPWMAALSNSPEFPDSSTELAELFPGTVAALDRLSIRPGVQS